MSIANDPAKKNFLRNLAETTAWCQPRAEENNPLTVYGPDFNFREWLERRGDDEDDRWKYTLRSEELRPPFVADKDCDDGISLWADRKMVEHVIAERRRRVTHESALPFDNCLHLDGGRLLAYFLDCSNFNGLAAYSTAYFLDFNDTPPWDAWVDVIRTPPIESESQFDELLVAWIPREFIEIADEGPQIECNSILMWVDEPISGVVPEECMPKWLRSLVADSR